MSEVPVRELNQDTAGVLARVKGGEEIDVTERGVVVARLVPAQAHPLADLVSDGVVTLPARRGLPPRPTGTLRPDSAVALREMRDDERY